MDYLGIEENDLFEVRRISKESKRKPKTESPLHSKISIRQTKRHDRQLPRTGLSRRIPKTNEQNQRPEQQQQHVSDQTAQNRSNALESKQKERQGKQQQTQTILQNSLPRFSDPRRSLQNRRFPNSSKTALHPEHP